MKCKEVKILQYIGKIDRNKLIRYKIATDIVVITRERKEHIQKRHFDDYSKYIQYIPYIIENPDYILEDNNNIDTILILKKLNEENKNIQIVIKLNTTKDKSRYNTVLTFWQIRDKNYIKTIQHNKIIYKNI